jgi:hypothetical protein
MNLLPKWLIIVALMAWTTTMQISATSSLDARLLSLWILLAGIIRFLCALQPYNMMLYGCTFLTFTLAAFHFTSECFIYHTANIYEPGVYMPLIISTVSIIWMLCTWRYYSQSSYQMGQMALHTHPSVYSKYD